jgi:hypothetical protein
MPEPTITKCDSDVVELTADCGFPMLVLPLFFRPLTRWGDRG